MYILHRDLETAEASRLGCLNFVEETSDEVFVDDAIGGSEESKDMINKMALVIELVCPVAEVFREVHLLRPLVHFPGLWHASAKGVVW